MVGLTWLRQLLIVVAVLGLALGSAGDPREIHGRGVEALEQRRWQDAVRFFSAAIAERSEEKVPRLGRRYYLPHFYLGVALAELGDCTGALDAWAESERQGKLARAEELAATLPDRRNACRDHLRRVELAQTEVEGVLEQAEGTAPTLEALAQRQALTSIWATGEGSYAARVASARQRLADARRRLGEGRDRSDLEILGNAKDLAAQALIELRAVISDARRQLGELNAAADSALEELGVVEAAALEAVRSVFDLQPYPPGLAGRVGDVQRTLARIDERRDVALAPELLALGGELQEAIDALQSAGARPPSTLFQAVEAFLGGRYQEVLELLAETPYSRGRSAIHACHLEAASRYSLFILGGEVESELLELARQGALRCHGLAPSFTISRKYFSPRYVAFLDETVNPPAADDPLASPDAGDEPQGSEADAAPTEATAAAGW